MGAPGERIGKMIETVRRLGDELLASLGGELIDVEYQTAGSRGTLRLYIDKPGGVTLDDCVQVSRQLGALLDVEDVVPFSYTLEVSSPGLNRPLKRPKDFQAHCGKKIKLKTTAAVNGQRRFTGILRAYEPETESIVLESGGQLHRLPLANLSKCNLVYEFADPGKRE